MEETRALTKMEETVVREAAETLGLRIKKLHRRISWEEFNERWFKGLCMFCDEPETPDHHLRHKNSGILMIDCDEDQMSHDKELVETEVATESSETEQRTLNHEATADMNLALLEEESIPQFQVPIANSEILKSGELREVKLGKLEVVAMNKNLVQDGVQENVNKRFDVDRDQKVTSNTQIGSTHQMLDKMPLRVRSKMRRSKCPKCWRFKFKNRDLRGYNLSRVKLLLKNSLVITRFWQWFMMVNGYKQCHMLEHANIEAESFPLLNFAAEQPRLWMQNNSEPILILSELERKKKKLCLKTWMFKYKNVEECIKRLHYQLRYNFRLENERCCERESRKKCHSYVGVSELLHKSHGTGIAESLMLSLFIKAAYGKKYVSNNEVRSYSLNSLSEDDINIVILGIKVFSPEEVVEDQIHDKLTIRWKDGIEGVMEFFLGIGMGKHQREITEAKQNLKHWYGDSLLEFLKRMEAGSSMIMVLYNNTELINYLYHLEKSCLVSIIRIENALIEARFVKTMEEYSKNHLASTLAYELFHSPRPPDLFVADRMILTKEETEDDMKEDDQKKQGDWGHNFLLVAVANQSHIWSAGYHVWHRWKARCFYVGMILTMRAWLFGEEGFDIGK
ncbi:hypothetical protein ISN45_Aa04g008700 [Arabidopsis thaliana x Arabidopsis arenosa]|uniref:Uncharacterized protein n=1 Tax=Arabidopsis thaliana x Arabidopsis arenosa TaxID=1240361 RepID=A0A8T2A7M6_9BRAS|nr:hypothetical protein ISN45_Aa04g008700 [Arabidopsis thaliana x Arabidopsis arenosa]KAG7568033.1 hypothetical protein ISN45_Aa04g008700 [Arabidopsis thaliana x Arabidopsis arenosa]